MQLGAFYPLSRNHNGPEYRVSSSKRRVLFFKKKNLFIYYIYSILSTCTPAGQKGAPDLITDGCEPPCGCWELNSGPLEELAMLLTTQPSLQSKRRVFEWYSLAFKEGLLKILHTGPHSSFMKLNIYEALPLEAKSWVTSLKGRVYGWKCKKDEYLYIELLSRTHSQRWEHLAHLLCW